MSSQGPDFIGIGMPNCGTRWLYDQLANHSEVRLPPIKELHFLDQGMRLVSAENRLIKRSQRRRQESLSSADAEFLDRYLNSSVSEELKTIQSRSDETRSPKFSRYDLCATVRLEPRNFEWYLSLFDPYKPKFTGDVTPGYYAVDKEKIAQFRSYCPQVKLVMMIRHPAENLISRVKKRIRKGRFSVENVDAIIERIRGKAVDLTDPAQAVDVPAAQASRTFENWSSVFGEHSIQAVVFDDLVADPGRVRTDLCRHIGLSQDVSQFSVAADYNRKAKTGEHEKITLDINEDAIYALVTEETKRCQKLFGGATANWRLA